VISNKELLELIKFQQEEIKSIKDISRLQQDTISLQREVVSFQQDTIDSQQDNIRRVWKVLNMFDERLKEIQA